MATRSSGRADPASSTATGQRGAKLRLFGIVEMYLLYESSLTLRTLERDAQGTSSARCISRVTPLPDACRSPVLA
jgi:hypothetical protein